MNKVYIPLADRVLGCAIEVHKNLGPGLMESAYQKCFAYELEINDLKFEREYPLPIKYKGLKIESAYKIDFLIENSLIIELKSVREIENIHKAQILTYMRLLGIKHGFLLNFNTVLLKHGIKSLIL